VDASDPIAQRIACLQPSATATLVRLGQLHRIAACTKWCRDVCPEITDSGATVISDSWSSTADEILSCNPDLVIASVPYQVEALAQILKAAVPFLALAPKSLADIYASISPNARAMIWMGCSGSRAGVPFDSRWETICTAASGQSDTM